METYKPNANDEQSIDLETIGVKQDENDVFFNFYGDEDDDEYDQDDDDEEEEDFDEVGHKSLPNICHLHSQTTNKYKLECINN